MIRRYCLWLLAAGLLSLSGCASVTTQPPAQAAPTQPLSQEASPQAALPQAAPGQSAIATPPSDGGITEPAPRPPVSGNKAVIALLDRAHLDAESGRRESAGASLERALRIEPRNAWLWHEMAQLRLAQGLYAQAISLAQKSSSFASRERRLRALNWHLIGNARVAQGNRSGAEQAFKLAAELEQ